MTALHITTPAELRAELRDLERQARTSPPRIAATLHRRAVALAAQYRELAA